MSRGLPDTLLPCLHQPDTHTNTCYIYSLCYSFHPFRERLSFNYFSSLMIFFIDIIEKIIIPKMNERSDLIDKSVTSLKGGTKIRFFHCKTFKAFR